MIKNKYPLTRIDNFFDQLQGSRVYSKIDLWRFVEGFAKITTLLMCLTHKRTKFVWSDECDQSFRELKEKLTAPVLALPASEKSFVAYSDASYRGLWCVLMQGGELLHTLLVN